MPAGARPDPVAVAHHPPEHGPRPEAEPDRHDRGVVGDAGCRERPVAVVLDPVVGHRGDPPPHHLLRGLPIGWRRVERVQQPTLTMMEVGGHDQVSLGGELRGELVCGRPDARRVDEEQHRRPVGAVGTIGHGTGDEHGHLPVVGRGVDDLLACVHGTTVRERHSAGPVEPDVKDSRHARSGHPQRTRRRRHRRRSTPEPQPRDRR